MDIFRQLDDVKGVQKGKAVALGFFDGVHLGHRGVIQLARSAGLYTCVFTFSSHPKQQAHGNPVGLICSETERLELMSEAGADGVLDVDFNSVKDLTPEDFVRYVLADLLHAKFVCCGFNYRFGKNGAGDVKRLKDLCAEFGIEVKALDEVVLNGLTVSSSNIRLFLQQGEMEKANEMLGRAYGYSGIVKAGNQIGSQLSVPTINQTFDPLYIIPKYGVYFSSCIIDGQTYPSITNIGVRPTVGSDVPLSETMIFNFSGNLYGKNVRVLLHHFLRPEIKFESLAELKKKMEKDITQAKAYHGL